MSYRRGRRRNNRRSWQPVISVDEVFDAIATYERVTGETLDLEDFNSPDEVVMTVRALLGEEEFEEALLDDASGYDPADDDSFGRPRNVEGGIRAQPLSGFASRKWWSARWRDTLDTMCLQSRLQRGIHCARNGTVFQLELDPDRARARVQGSRWAPYEVSISLAPYGRNKWKALAGKLAEKPLLLAQMLAGQLPRDMESLCAEVDIALFPRDIQDLSLVCDCADSITPCKHIVAVYYVLGEVFAADPFFIFHMRGMSREGLLALMGLAPPPTVRAAKVLEISPLPRDAEPASAPKPAPEGARVFEIAPPVAPRPSPDLADGPKKSPWPEREKPNIPSADVEDPAAPPDLAVDDTAEGAPLCADLERFWRQQGDPAPTIRVPDTYPAISGALPKQLGPIPCWQSSSSLPQFLSRHYGKASMMLYEARQIKR